jgi:hypothetical protein
MWPKGINLPPCAGGVLTVKYADGTTGSDWGEEEDVTELVLMIQENLNAAGYVDADGNPLEEDGVLGPKTKFAHATMVQDAENGGGTRDRVARRISRGNRDMLEAIHDATAFEDSA